MTHQEFLTSPEARQRYWTRSAIGLVDLFSNTIMNRITAMYRWKIMAEAKPNAAHTALVALEKRGVLQHIITQNVDRLHQQAGSIKVLDLHGDNSIDNIKS